MGTRQILTFKSPSIINDAEVFTAEFTIRGWVRDGINPREINQDSLQVGVAYYTIHLHHNSSTLAIKPSWKITAVTMNNIELHLIGPPVDVNGEHTMLRFHASHVV